MTNFRMRMRIYFGVTIICYIIFFHHLISNSGDTFLNFWFSYIFVLSVFQNRSFYYLFFVELIKYELHLIWSELDEIMSNRHSGKSKSVWKEKDFIKQFYRIRFKWIREFYQSIYDMNIALNTVFGWSNVVIILLSFHLMLGDINYVYWKFLNKYQFSILGNVWLFQKQQ